MSDEKLSNQSYAQYDAGGKDQEHVQVHVPDEHLVNTISRQEVCNGLMMAIAYLQASYPAIADEHVQNLLAVLKLLDHEVTDNQTNILELISEDVSTFTDEDKEQVKEEGHCSLTIHEHSSLEKNKLNTVALNIEPIDHKMTANDILYIKAKKKHKGTRQKNATEKCRKGTKSSTEINKETSGTELQRLPQMLSLKPSCIQDVGNGVFTNTYVPEKTLFGPLRNWMMVASNIENSQISSVTEKEQVGASYMWMTLVRHTEDIELQTVELVKCDEQYYYQTTRELIQNSELLLPIQSQTKKNSNAGRMVHTCVTCNKTFSRKDGLRKHIQTHLDVKSLKCEDCGKSFKAHSSLHYHKKLHTGKRDFKCQICGKLFTLRGGLKSHMITHNTEKPFSCAVCGKSFAQLGNLHTHERVHTGERPFSCSVCGERFSHRSTVRAHMFRHTGERNHQCPICGKQYYRIDVLKNHMDLHCSEKNHKCTTCDKRFTTAGYLQIHMKSHSGEKPHLCTTCGERFTRSQSLKRHIQGVHLKINCCKKSYACMHCRREFKRSDHLLRHFRSAHKELEAPKSIVESGITDSIAAIDPETKSSEVIYNPNVTESIVMFQPHINESTVTCTSEVDDSIAGLDHVAESTVITESVVTLDFKYM